MSRRTMSHADVVVFDSLPTACGRRFGVATLNNPSSLNALSLSMVRLLSPKLDEWAADPSVAGVVLQGAGPSAFCAGGDLRALYPVLKAGTAATDPLPRAFFDEEYSLDLAIHRYPKPVLCWGHGVVMGGGMGLMNGASHRVVTPASKLAMPEIVIGLFPDVGGSWFLRRMPGLTGLFAGLTGVVLTAADALFAGWADMVVEHERKADVLQALAAHAWSGDAATDRSSMTSLLQSFALADTGQSQLRSHAAAIDALMAGDELIPILERLRRTQSDPWLERAADNMRKGSPTSAAVIHALWRHVEGWPLEQVLALEKDVALACCIHPDFGEGIRALLIDKDRNPQWTPSRIEALADGLPSPFRTALPS